MGLVRMDASHFLFLTYGFISISWVYASEDTHRKKALSSHFPDLHDRRGAACSVASGTRHVETSQTRPHQGTKKNTERMEPEAASFIGPVYTLDTNAIIYYLRDDPDVVPVLDDIVQRSMLLYVSPITETELFRFPRIDTTETERIENILRSTISIVIDSKIARMAGEIQWLYGLQTADGIIAATALFTGSTLLTRNIRDFHKIPQLKSMKI